MLGNHWSISPMDAAHLQIAYGQFRERLNTLQRKVDQKETDRLAAIAKEAAHKKLMALKYPERSEAYA